jgi:hypothetical protein
MLDVMSLRTDLAALRTIDPEATRPRSIVDRWADDEATATARPGPAEDLDQVSEQDVHAPRLLEDRAGDQFTPPVV